VLDPLRTKTSELWKHSRDYGMPPLAALATPRDESWRADLRAILAALRAAGGPVAALDAAAALSDAEAPANRISAGATLDADAALVPFAGVALEAATPQHLDVPTVCPVCGTRPVASVVRLGGERNNLRYLYCALCRTEWNLARIQCSSCEGEKGVHNRACITCRSRPQTPTAAAPPPACAAPKPATRTRPTSRFFTVRKTCTPTPRPTI
jgi:FdhE protein